MKQNIQKAPLITFRQRISGVIPIIAILFLSSFTVVKLKEELFKRLGMVKTETDKKISDSFFGGYLNTYGVANLKNILAGDRVGVTKDLLVYTKQYIGSETFAKEYNALREQYHPKLHKVETPAEMREGMIAMYKKSIAETEERMKKADANMKKVFADVLADARKYLKDAEDSNNKAVANYTRNYQQAVASNQASYEYCMKVWETKYPADPRLFVKERLNRFLTETNDIDFGAELTTKGNKKVFVDPAYEAKSYYWKMAFRAGKESVEAARTFVQQWLTELS